MTARTRLVCLVVPLAAAGLAAQSPPPRAEQPTFRTGTTLVEVSAIVTRDGVPVTDLRQDEVQLFDEGVEQPLVAFEYVDLTDPSRGQGAPLTHPTSSAVPSRARDYVLVLDDLHIAPRLTRPTMDTALALVDGLAPDDRLAIVNTGPHELVLQLSTDREAARGLIRRFRGQRGMGAAGANEQAMTTLIFLRVLRSVADAMRGDAIERRSVLVISEGQTLGPTSPATAGDDHDVWRAYQDVVAAASAANAVVYAVNPVGLEAAFPGVGTGGNHDAALVAGSAAARAADAMVARYHGTLGRLSGSTGGTLTADRNDLLSGVTTMLRDSRQYYRLAYRQPDVPEDVQGKPRAIEVRVARRGVDVRARRAYVPWREG